jgi:hypothetical protein
MWLACITSRTEEKLNCDDRIQKEGILSTITRLTWHRHWWTKESLDSPIFTAPLVYIQRWKRGERVLPPTALRYSRQLENLKYLMPSSSFWSLPSESHISWRGPVHSAREGTSPPAVHE